MLRRIFINQRRDGRRASVKVEVVDEVTGDPIDCNVKLSGIEVGRAGQRRVMAVCARTSDVAQRPWRW